MRRLLLPCAMSLLLYAITFGLLLDRPLSLGVPQAQIEAKLLRGAAIEGRKLVIIAGSSGPYSHRCETIEALLTLPCVNAGIAVGFSLDYLFARWQPLLHPGDVVYLPLEEAQYTRGRLANQLGPDAAIMARHDRATLAALPPARWIAAVFVFDLRAAVMSVIETALVAAGFHDPREEATGATNAWGDHIDHTAARGTANRGILAALTPHHATPAGIAGGDGQRIVSGFIDWARAHEVTVLGGPPIGFQDSPVPAETLAAIRAVYDRPGAGFLSLPNDGRYARSAFFDTPEHLHEAGQIAHSRLVATQLYCGARIGAAPIMSQRC